MYLLQSSLPACIWGCFITSTSSFINIFHDYLSWSYSCKTGECDFYTVTRNSQSEHYPMYKMIWLDDFVVQIRNLYMKQPIRTLYPMHKMIWLDDFVVQIRNSYSKQSIRTLYSMHKMIWLDDFVEQIRNLYMKQPIRTLYSMHKMIWLDDFVEQIRNSYSKKLWVGPGFLYLVEG
jgi:hypothetical protein